MYGTALSVSQLNASVGVSGTFAYSPAAGTILGAGSYTLSVVFTPSDTYDYSSVTDSVSLVVSPAVLTVTASNATRIYGQANPVFMAGYSGFVNGSPSLNTTATATSAVSGSPYAIVAAQGTLSAANYSFAFNNGQLAITPDASAETVSSSANPSPFGANVTFTATVTAVSPGSGTPTGTIQFYVDSVAFGSPVALAGGAATISGASLSTGTHAVSAQYSGDGNFIAGAGSLSPNQVISPSGSAATIVLPRNPNSGAKISVAALLADNPGAMTLVSTDSTSTNGGTVAVNENWIFYTPATGFTNADAFNYVITNSLGTLSTGTVSVVVPVDTSQSQNIDAVQSLGNGAVFVQFQGIPGRSYTIQYTPSLQTPVWQTLGSGTAGATGGFGITNTPTQGQPAGYYRSTYP
jgi:hypothetical protein